MLKQVKFNYRSYNERIFQKMKYRLYFKFQIKFKLYDFNEIKFF